MLWRGRCGVGCSIRGVPSALPTLKRGANKHCAYGARAVHLRDKIWIRVFPGLRSETGGTRRFFAQEGDRGPASMGGRCCYGEGDFGGAGALVVSVDDGYAEVHGTGR